MVTIKEPTRGRLDAVVEDKAPSVMETVRFLWSQKAAVHAMIGAGLSAFWGWGLMWFTPLFLQRTYGMDEGAAGGLLGEIALQAFFQGFLVVCVAMWTYARATELLGAVKVAVMMSTVPVVGTLLSVPLLGEDLGSGAALGVVIVFLGALLGALAKSPAAAPGQR